MSAFKLNVVRDNVIKEITASADESILHALREAGYTEPDAPCGGKGLCKKCNVRVTGKVKSVETGETKDVIEEELLSCRYEPASDLTVILAASTQMNVAVHGAEDLDAGGSGLGFAVDIGTTTVASFLYDLETGKSLGKLGDRNAQRSYGADVISRINACSEGKLPVLAKAIRTQLTGMAGKLCDSAYRSTREITQITVAGNTTIQHLFAELSPINIGVAPFTPESLFGDHRPSSECLPDLDADADVYMTPAVAGYVGGDITAGMYASGCDKAEGLWLYIDIGTNGEMALGNKNGYMSCATAAGPAFEGAEIACGMDGSPGAIDKVKVADGDVAVHVIGDIQAKGVCGSGLIDAIACMLQLGVIAETGRMLNADELPEKLAKRIFKTEDGFNAFMLKDGIYIAAQDVREVQLAKAAIRAGAETLLETQGKTASDITALVIAGGFGSYMDKLSALAIGLLPEVDPEIIRHVGNAAGAGAVIALTEDGRKAMEEFTKEVGYLELSSSSEFMENYVEYMGFE